MLIRQPMRESLMFFKSTFLKRMIIVAVWSCARVSQDNTLLIFGGFIVGIEMAKGKLVIFT